jgi:hypothetical protein
LPQLLDQLEEVVGPVDLVDLPGLRVTDDDARPVDPPRATATPAHQSLGFVLGAEVRVVEARRLLEHVLAEAALVAPRRGDRTRVVEAAGLHRLGALNRVIGADDVREVLLVDSRLQVVDGREMEEVVDLARQPTLIGLRHAEVGLGKVALDRDDAARARAPEWRAAPRVSTPTPAARARTRARRARAGARRGSGR